MSKTPCCEMMGLKKGPWSGEEDHILISHIQRHGHGNWRALPKQAGLLRCGKSCRLRWINYLRPDIKRGKFNKEEEDTILELHEILGNRWSAIAARLPGRTDNEIKNFWHTHLKKRVENNGKVYDANNTSSSRDLEANSLGVPCVVMDESNYGLLPPFTKDPLCYSSTAVSSDTSGENMGNHGCCQISEEMEFWYNVFIKSGQPS